MSHHHHDAGVDPDQMWTQQFWDERYAGADSIWSREPNPRLVQFASGLAPGTALDVGSGEGTDAMWLAARHWTVTGVDLSQVALDRAAARAAEVGLTDRLTWRHADLMDPTVQLETGYDLVSAQFMHAPLHLFDDLYRRIAELVAPGGSLLVAGHHPADAATGIRDGGVSHLLFTADQVAAVLDPDRWEIRVADALERDWTDAEGQSYTVTDAVVHAVRRPV